MSPELMPPEFVLIAGPTASGKSAFALKLAEQYDGVIINADSMQVYRELSIITARPPAGDEALVDHYLYGHKSGHEAYSVANWLSDVGELLDDILASGKVPIFVGGTGLYFKALLEGLSPVPELDRAIRQKWREYSIRQKQQDQTGELSLHDELMNRDPGAAQKLRPSDHQRLIRALEVYDSTGKSILEWQRDHQDEGLIGPGSRVEKVILMPERKLLHERINKRFDRMVELGAPEEVMSLMAQEVDPTKPIMKAIGVPQFMALIRGEISEEEAIEKAKAATRQYAKRQSTWFNNQFGADWERIG